MEKREDQSYLATMCAVAYYFVVPGIAYGSLTSRLPSIMEHAQAQAKDIGLMLFMLGASSLISLILSPRLIKRYGSPLMLLCSTLLMMMFTIATGFATNAITLILLGAGVGFFIGVIDVGMNTQGILIEKLFKRKSMSKLHAFYSLGAVFAGAVASGFAAFKIGAMTNLLVVLGFYMFFAYAAYKRLINDKYQPLPDSQGQDQSQSQDGTEAGADAQAQATAVTRKSMPLLVYVCGIVALLVYAIEGSVGEWGSIYLNQEKEASLSLAALVYSCFSLSAVVSKLFVDRLRDIVSDFLIIIVGGVVSFAAFALVLYVDNAVLCIVLYSIMGFAIAPIVPIAFSVAGAVPGIEARDASAFVAKLAYTGLLFFPPTLGFLAQAAGLTQALMIVLGQIVLVILLSFKFKK